MTVVVAVQPRSRDEDVVETLVPPPRPPWKSLLYGALFAGVVVALVVGSLGGFFSSHLDARADEWGAAAPTPGAYVVLTLTNARRFSTRLDGIDASGPGLHVRAVLVDGKQFPVTVPGH